MVLIYIIVVGIVAYLSLRSIAKNLKKGAEVYEYSKNEMKANGIYEDYLFDSRK